MTILEMMENAIERNCVLSLCFLGKDFSSFAAKAKDANSFLLVDMDDYLCNIHYLLNAFSTFEEKNSISICMMKAKNIDSDINELSDYLSENYARFVVFDETERITKKKYDEKVLTKYVANNSALNYKNDFLLNLVDLNRHRVISTGFVTVDNLIGGGFRDGLYVINGNTGVGKTSFLCEIVFNIILKYSIPVLYFSFEMAREELFAKMISSRMYKSLKKEMAMTASEIVDFMNIKKYHMLDSEEEYSSYLRENIENFFEMCGDNLNVFTEDAFIEDISVDEIGAIVKAFIKKTGKKPVVVIDYFQLISKSRKQVEQRMTELQVLEDNAKKLKQLSNFENCGVPIICLSSISRSKYYEPLELDASKGAGGIEYTANVVLGLQPRGWDYEMKNAKLESDNDRQRRIENTLRENKARAQMGAEIEYEIKCVKSRFSQPFLQNPTLLFNGKFSSYREK